MNRNINIMLSAEWFQQNSAEQHLVNMIQIKSNHSHSVLIFLVSSHTGKFYQPL